MSRKPLMKPVDFFGRLDEIGLDEIDRVRARDAFARAEMFADGLVRVLRFAWHAELPRSGRPLGPAAP